jgi:hypothetical protein
MPQKQKKRPIKKREEIVNVQSKWPIDFSALDYGDVIPNEVLVDYYGISEDDEGFRFKQIDFIQLVDSELRSRGIIATICVRDSQIKILTHEEAAEYNRRRFNCHVAGMARVHEKNMHVSSQELSKENRDIHTKTVMFQSKALQAVLKTKSEFHLESVKRKAPSLKPPK